MDIHGILKSVTAGIPRTAVGVDRQEAVGAAVEGMHPASREALRAVMDGFLSEMDVRNASDVDLGGAGCGGRVWYRVYGDKTPDETAGTFTEDETDGLFHCLLTDSQRRHLLSHRNLDFSYTASCNGRNSRYRGDLYFDLDHLALNMRYIPNKIRPFKELDLHASVAQAVMLATDKNGLTLVTGVTGSGKSSTLDSIIDANNEASPGHIVVIGAPVETIHAPKRSIVRHREVGRDVLSFKEGTVQALRQDPDIVVIGEMRDPETIVTALEVTDSGHKVFSTLHTASAVESVDRIIAECPSAEQNRVRERLADVLKCVVSQKLVPSLDGRRVLAKEVLLVNASVRAAIKNENTGEIYQMMHEGRALGMNTMEQDLKRLVSARRLAPKEALNFSNNRRRMEELL